MPTTSPTPSAGSPLVYSSTLGGLVLVNVGNTPAFLDYSIQTWLWSSGNWSLLTAGLANNPAARINTSACGDGSGNVVLAFGRNVPGTELMNQVDVFSGSGSTWSNAVPNYNSTGPAIREKVCMANLGSTIYAYGGNSNFPWTYTDIWELTGHNTWTALTPNTTVAPRYDQAFGSDGSANIVMFGGRNSTSCLNDTVLFNGTDWSVVIPGHTQNSPSTRFGSSFAYYPTTNGFLLFSGIDSSGDLLGDTWFFSLSSMTWTNLNPVASPPRRAYGSMCWDATSSQMILTSGLNSKNLYSDTWSYSFGANTWVQL